MKHFFIIAGGKIEDAFAIEVLKGFAEKTLCKGRHRLMAAGILQASVQNRGLVLDPGHYRRF